MNGPIRVLIVDDHPVVREGLQLFLAEETSDIELVGQAADGEEAVRLAARLRPDVLLMDLVMPGVDGIESIRRLRALGVESRVLVLTTFAEDELVRQAIQAGATGYLLKDVAQQDLVQAIRDAARGRPTLHPDAQERLIRQIAAPPPPSPLDNLTDREREVLALIARGKSNKEIATSLFLSVGTVKGYVSAILGKLGVSDRTQAALVAVRHDPTEAERE